MIYWIWLSNIKGIGIQRQRALLEHFKSPQQIYFASKDELMQVKDFGSARAEQILNNRSLETATHILEQCRRKQIQVMTFQDAVYPEYAKEICEMPVMLYYKGKPREDSIGVAVVGARRCTKEGKERAIELAYCLTRESIPVVSGMAKGIDSYAHTACLKAGGYTVAVLGCGLDICYPGEHKLLMQRIEERGLLLSEYPPGTPPCRCHFPKRNRIIAAWSREIYIPEAGKKSGARITGAYGEKYGRRVNCYHGTGTANTVAYSGIWEISHQ